MTDRVPGAPGQYQAVITAEEQQKLSAAEPFVITLTRDDQPIAEGTPYSKAAVLPDSLGSVLCPHLDDPTPADALKALSDRQLESQEHPGCFYRMVDGEVEWLNPPMMEGQEYRTAERFEGKAVYVKRLDLGAMPAGTKENPQYKWVSTGVDARWILSWQATARREVYLDAIGGYATGRLDQFPYLITTQTDISGKLYFDFGSVVVVSTGDLSDVTEVNLWIKYTKDAVKA